MLGILRFLLALAVLFSHIPGIEWRLYPGVTAVICFYIISGSLMHQSFNRFRQFSRRPVRDFYSDRFIKLFPQYLLVTLTTALLLNILGPSESYWLLQQEPSSLKLLLNILLLPANYVFEPFVFDALLPHPLVAPGWSLATEFQFYLLLPLLFLRKKLLLALLFGTICIQFSSFLIDAPRFSADAFGYRYLFGVLPIFLLGYLHADGMQKGRWLPFLALWGIYVVAAVIAWLYPKDTPMRMHQIVIGAALAPVILYVVVASMNGSKQSTIKRIDSMVGSLAYPIFITHCLAFFIVEKVSGLRVTATTEFVVRAVILCLALSIALLYFQRPFEKARINLRGFPSMRKRSLTPEGSPAISESSLT